MVREASADDFVAKTGERAVRNTRGILGGRGSLGGSQFGEIPIVGGRMGRRMTAGHIYRTTSRTDNIGRVIDRVDALACGLQRASVQRGLESTEKNLLDGRWTVEPVGVGVPYEEEQAQR